MAGQPYSDFAPPTSSIRAASDPDTSQLRAVLSEYIPTTQEPNQNGKRTRSTESCGPNSLVNWPGQDVWTTPLLEAVKAQLPENIDVLLEAGAEPSGTTLSWFERYHALFLRFRPKIPNYVDMDGDIATLKDLLDCMTVSQTAPITDLEIEQRTVTITPFWLLTDTRPLDQFPGAENMHSLTTAARQQSSEVFDQLVKGGADISNWVIDRAAASELQQKPSSLAVLTPLHAAIESRNVPMLNHLLSTGLDPNICSTSTPKICIMPLMATLVGRRYHKTLIDDEQMQVHYPPGESHLTHTPAKRLDIVRIADLDSSSHSSTSSDLPSSFNASAYNILIHNKAINPDNTTPILNIHLLHLTVAHLSLPLLKYILSTAKVSISSVARTALGHNLLHIACMPPCITLIDTGSHAITKSIHDTRDLCYPSFSRATKPPQSPAPPFPLLWYHCEQFHSHKDVKDFSSYFDSQKAIVTLLLGELSNTLIVEQDAYGNTPLHYLAAHRVVNLTLLKSLTQKVATGHEGELGSERKSTPAGVVAEDSFETVKNRWGYTAKDLLEDPGRSVNAAETNLSSEVISNFMNSSNNALREQEKAERDLRTRIDAWWDNKLEHYDDPPDASPEGPSSSRGRGGGGRGRGSGRRGRRQGLIRPSIVYRGSWRPFPRDDFPYSLRKDDIWVN